MGDVETHPLARVPGKVNGNNLATPHGKHVVLCQRLRLRARHV